MERGTFSKRRPLTSNPARPRDREAMARQDSCFRRPDTKMGWRRGWRKRLREGPTTLIAQSPSAIEGSGRGILWGDVVYIDQLFDCYGVSCLMQCDRSDGCVCTAFLHELMSQKEHLQRYHHTTLALSRLLMQSLIGHRPCGSIRLWLRSISPTARRCIPFWEGRVRGFPPPRPNTHSRRPLSVSIAQTRDM